MASGKYYRYQSSDTKEHNLHYKDGRVLTMEEIGELCGVGPEIIRKNLKDPECPRSPESDIPDNLPAFLFWRFAKYGGGKNAVLAEIEIQIKQQQLRKETALATIRTNQAKASEADGRERAKTAFEREKLLREEKELEIKKKRRDMEIQNKELVNHKAAQGELDKAAIMIKMIIENQPNNFAERWGGMSGDEIFDEMTRENNKILNIFSEIDTTKTPADEI